MFSRNFTAKGKEKNWESWCLCKAVWVSVGFGSRTCQIMVAFYKMSEYSQFSSVQSLSHVRLCDPKDGCISGLPPCLSPTPGVYSSSCPSSRWCHPIISSSVIPVSSCLQSFPASGSFPMSQLRWPKYWSFNFSISPSNEYSGLICFRMDWLDLAVQGTHKSLLQHHSSKASILQHSAFFIVQLLYPLSLSLWLSLHLERGTRHAY